MCGITGYVGGADAVSNVLEGLTRLEYRGYDSAGVAVVAGRKLHVHKRTGKVRALKESVPSKLKGRLAIAHTRWATHGGVTEANAHPHIDARGEVAVVHNGIIENASELRAALQREGVELRSDTDTEVLAHLIARSPSEDLAAAVRDALRVVRGTYGLLVVSAKHPDELVAARNGSPMVIGIGDKEMFVASDPAAFIRFTRQVVYLDDGEVATVSASRFETTDLHSVPMVKEASTLDVDIDQYGKGGHGTYFRKEVLEQPDAVRQTLRGRLDASFSTAVLGGIDLEPRDILGIKRVKVLGCGSAYFAGMAGALVLERLARIPADAEPAPEFAQRHPVIEPDTLYVAVSQSGETADILTTVREIQRKGGRVVGVVNVVGSSLARLCNGGIYLHAGPEVSVASTKAFTCMHVAFTLMGLLFGRVRDLGPTDGDRIVRALDELPSKIEEVLALEEQIACAAARLTEHEHVLFLGRVSGYPIAMEAALKMKELSYIHAEGYAASELKHGAIALVTGETPTVAILLNDGLRDKNLSSIQQVRARKGPVVVVSAGPVDRSIAEEVIEVPSSEPEIEPLLVNVALQLLAYHAATILGRDIDQPRNLAKSVTVE